MLYMYFLRNFVIFQTRGLELIGCKLQLAMLCEGLILSEQDIVLKKMQNSMLYMYFLRKRFHS